MDEVDEGLLRTARQTMDEVDRNLSQCRFKAAIASAFGLAQEANRYLDAKAPWRAIKEDPGAAATSLWVSMCVINCLKVLLYPFLPFSSQKLHEFLGFDGRVEDGQWDFDHLMEGLTSGAGLRRPAPLFTKLEPEVVEQEVNRLGVGAS